MGSPWPWTQEPVKATNHGASMHHGHNHNNNNNKRVNYGYESRSPYYNNHHNHEFHQSFNQNQQQNPHNGNRFIPSTSLPPVVTSTPGDPMISNENVVRKRLHPQHNTYFNFEGNYHNVPPQPPPPPQPNPSYRKVPVSTTSFSTSTTSSSTAQQSQFVTFVKEIPTWNIYYSDQKHRIIDFTDKNNSIRPDQDLNQLVSLCFVDTCITNLAVDAIVNSTTANYCGLNEVDKLIHQQAGRSLREACKSLPTLAPGQAEMTLGFSLPAKYVIHTNGPLTEDAEQLTGCYVNSLNLLLMHRLRTIAFPCISTEKGLSKKFAAEIALRTVRQFLEEHKQEVDRVIFCLHHQKDIEIYLRYMQIYFPVAVVDPEYRIGRWEHYLRIDRDF